MTREIEHSDGNGKNRDRGEVSSARVNGWKLHQRPVQAPPCGRQYSWNEEESRCGQRDLYPAIQDEGDSASGHFGGREPHRESVEAFFCFPWCVPSPAMPPRVVLRQLPPLAKYVVGYVHSHILLHYLRMEGHWCKDGWHKHFSGDRLLEGGHPHPPTQPVSPLLDHHSSRYMYHPQVATELCL